MVRINIYRRIGWIAGHRIIKKVKERLNYAGIKINSLDWVGFVLVMSILIGILTFFVSYIFMNIIYSSIFGMIFTGVTLIISSIFLDILIDKRSKFVESILPELLSILSINLRGGLTLEESLIASGKPEFGFFSRDLIKMAKELQSGETIDTTIKELKSKVNSLVLHRILDLIKDGIKSGGEVAIILEKSAESLRRTALLREEVKASVTGYFWFIFLASSIAAPLLFGTTFFLEEMLAKLVPKVSTTAYKFAPRVIPPNQILYFFLLNITIIGFFSGLLAGIIKNGKEKYGIKYIPIILVISFITFFGVKYILKIFLGKF